MKAIKNRSVVGSIILGISLLCTACSDDRNTNNECANFCASLNAACQGDNDFTDQCEQCLSDAEVDATACTEQESNLSENSSDQECTNILDTVIATGSFNQALPPASCLTLATDN